VALSIHHARLNKLERLDGPSVPSSATPYSWLDLTPRFSQRAERRCRRASANKHTQTVAAGAALMLKTGADLVRSVPALEKLTLRRGGTPPLGFPPLGLRGQFCRDRACRLARRAALLGRRGLCCSSPPFQQGGSLLFSLGDPSIRLKKGRSRAMTSCKTGSRVMRRSASSRYPPAVTKCERYGYLRNLSKSGHQTNLPEQIQEPVPPGPTGGRIG
jgi:hypothetical protein